MKKILILIILVGMLSASKAQYWSVFQNSATLKFGIKDQFGKELLPANYIDIKLIDSTYAIVSTQSNKGLVSNKGVLLIPNNFDEIKQFMYPNSREYYEKINHRFWIKKNGKWGIFEVGFGEVIPCKYDSIGAFKHQINSYNTYSYSVLLFLRQPSFKYSIVKMNGKWGIVDSTFQTKIPFDYDQFGTSNNDLILAKKNNKWGLISMENQKVIADFIYDSLFFPIINDQTTNQYLFSAQIGDSLYVVNSSGFRYPISIKERPYFRLINPEYGCIEGEKGLILYFFKTQKMLNTTYLGGYSYLLWDNSTIFHNDLTLKPLILDNKGKVIYSFKNMMTDSYAESFIINSHFFFDGAKIYEKTASEVVKKYDVKEDKKLGVNISDVIQILPIIFVVKSNGKYGLVFRKEDSFKEILPCQFNNINYSEEYYDFASSRFEVNEKGLFGYVALDKDTVKWIIPMDYQRIVAYDSPWYIVAQNGKFGVFILFKGLVVPCEYKTKEEAVESMYKETK
ncbi:MAG: WG repeat-containing protein [Bacteroidota bacterium]